MITRMLAAGDIVRIEHENLLDEMRMVILTDYIRKEYCTTEEINIDKIGVMSIFKTLVAKYENLKMAILTGGIFVIPKELFGISEKYVEVTMPEKDRNDVMNCISKLFEIGKIQVIVGTKSLLGEGWDEPSINSLILATFVGSFMLSNQMRGRAIRTNSNPNKTANIWHLVCVCDSFEKDNAIENTDVNLLKRRFQSFAGIGFESNEVTSGLERLGNFDGKFSEQRVNELNKKMENLSNDRDKMFKAWENAVEKKTNMKMVEQVELEEPPAFTSEWLVSKNLKNAIGILVAAIVLLITGTFPRWIVAIVGAGALGYVLFQIMRIKKLSNSEETVKIISEVLLEAMKKKGYITEQNAKVKITNQFGNISSCVEGTSMQESTMFVTSLTEIFSKFENQRYIIVAKKSNISKYFNIPKIFGNNKETAEFFVNIWKNKIGKVELIYTRSTEGRKQLLKARMQNINTKGRANRRQILSDWK